MGKTLSGYPLLVGVILAASIAGCGDSSATPDLLPRRAVAGTVTLDGKPLPVGRIEFDPADPGSKLVAVSGEVKDGKFSIERVKGPAPGKYKVVISGLPFAQISPDADPGPAPKRAVDPIPAKYNTKTTLTKDIDASTSDMEFAITSR